jgi:hypothetical protein
VTAGVVLVGDTVRLYDTTRATATLVAVVALGPTVCSAPPADFTGVMEQLATAAAPSFDEAYAALGPDPRRGWRGLAASPAPRPRAGRRLVRLEGRGWT